LADEVEFHDSAADGAALALELAGDLGDGHLGGDVLAEGLVFFVGPFFVGAGVALADVGDAVCGFIG
jgi:hypothetical protein